MQSEIKYSDGFRQFFISEALAAERHRLKVRRRAWIPAIGAIVYLVVIALVLNHLYPNGYELVNLSDLIRILILLPASALTMISFAMFAFSAKNPVMELNEEERKLL